MKPEEGRVWRKTGRHERAWERRERELATLARQAARAAAVSAVVAASVAGSAAVHAAWATQAPVTAPRSCDRPSLPPGDAARLDGREYVCTDGAWIRVTGYGA
jgi:hypothetical protein